MSDNKKKRIKEVIICEGRYDKNTILQVVDTSVIETRGFSVFTDKKLVNFIRGLAEKRGIIILTDSDSAGFLIRNYLKGVIPKEHIKHAYIPSVDGKEKRKREGSAEGKLGVEGMPPEVILEALRTAGAEFIGGDTPVKGCEISFSDMYEAGLSGSPNSAVKRKALLKRLGLPEYISASAMAELIGAMLTREEFFAAAEEIGKNIS
ncbi:MAG: DUF4093 domain-containing protein [Oscillospiraceae bacterium]|jgi:ribonuclease M5|nr:DUF4093 domain-containing protein [Oscillospiraceae bacterium]